jgi:L-arabinokinase
VAIPIYRETPLWSLIEISRLANPKRRRRFALPAHSKCVEDHMRRDDFDIIQEAPHTREDTREFLDLLDRLHAHPMRECRELFDNETELWVARAPGRLDLMGGIADYSGSLVLELPIAEAAFVALQRDVSRTIRIVTLTSTESRDAVFEMSLDNFERDGAPVDYDEARKVFQGPTHWAAYVAGAFLVLMRERGVRFQHGARILLGSKVPEGMGVSSSAAVEVAAMSAVATAFGLELAPRDLALLCQKVENSVAGAPCGVMDQMTAVSGVEGKLLALLCQPAEIQETIDLPDDLAVWGVESGERHSIRDADYASVRAGAFMGYRIIAEVAGLKTDSVDGVARVEDGIWGGYLANVTPFEFENSYVEHIPERLAGADFLNQYGGTTDEVARVDPERDYAVLKPTSHPVYEHARVRTFVGLLRGPASARRNKQLGKLMYQSHASYSECGLGSAGTDLLVNLVRESGGRSGLYGAKITGGGSGGTVAILGARNAEAAVRQVAARYEAVMHYNPYVFTGSSPGSAGFAHLRVRSETAKI